MPSFRWRQFLLASVFVGVGFRWRRFSLASVFVGIGFRCCWFSLLSVFVVVSFCWRQFSLTSVFVDIGFRWHRFSLASVFVGIGFRWRRFSLASVFVSVGSRQCQISSVSSNSYSTKRLIGRGLILLCVFLYDRAIMMCSYKVWSYTGQSQRDVKVEYSWKVSNVLTCMGALQVGNQ